MELDGWTKRCVCVLLLVNSILRYNCSCKLYNDPTNGNYNPPPHDIVKVLFSCPNQWPPRPNFKLVKGELEFNVRKSDTCRTQFRKRNFVDVGTIKLQHSLAEIKCSIIYVRRNTRQKFKMIKIDFGLNLCRILNGLHEIEKWQDERLEKREKAIYK